MTGKLEVPVVVVTTNAEKDLPRWLEAVKKFENKTAIAVPCVVDNGSWDGTAGILWSALKDQKPSERLLAPENVFWLRKNQWFVSAQNYAFRQLGMRNKYKYIVTLNQDAIANPDWLDKLVDCAQKHKPSDKTGMFGGLIFDTYDNTRISSAGHCLRSRDGAFLDIDYRKESTDPHRHSAREDFQPFSPCFAAAMWDIDMIREVGFPDNDQLIYYDDVELAYKARLRNWGAIFVPDAKAYHPTPQKTDDPVRLSAQVRGRLTLVARYFPENERQRVLSNAASDISTDLLKIALGCKPYCDNAERERIFEEWANKWSK